MRYSTTLSGFLLLRNCQTREYTGEGAVCKGFLANVRHFFT